MTFSAVLHHWSKTCTWHGVLDIYNAVNSLRRCIWLSIVCLFTIVLIWQLQSLSYSYISDNHYITSITTELRTEVPFPNVTVCNYNRANNTKVVQLNISKDTLAYMYLGLPQTYKIATYGNSLINLPLKTSYDDWRSTYNGSLSILDMFTYLGHDCEKTLILCSFGNIRFNCCESAYTVVNQYGKCISVNPTGTLSAKPTQHNAGQMLIPLQ